MVEGVVMYDGVNRYGMRHVHVMRGGRPVDVDAWLKHLGIDRDRLRLINEYEEEDTRMWHLHLAWMEEGEWEEWEKTGQSWIT
jgi:hypothetical protein